MKAIRILLTAGVRLVLINLLTTSLQMTLIKRCARVGH